MATGIIDTSIQDSIKVINEYYPCLYFSVVTFTTLGYGDFRPTKNARAFAAVKALFGYILLGILVSTIIYYLRELSKEPPKFK